MDTTRPPGRPKVLIVDDNRNVRRVLAFMLDDVCEIVAEAETGLEALTQAWEHRPDVIVLDHEMPVMTGREAARFLRIVSPASWIVGFSASHDVSHDWADEFLAKERISELPGLLENRLVAEAVA